MAKIKFLLQLLEFLKQLILAEQVMDQRLVLDFAEKRKGADSEIKDDKLLEIEKLMEEKTFSRSADVPKVHQECKDIILSARGAKDTIGPQNLRRPTEGKQDDSNKAVWDVATPLPKPTLPNETGC